MFQKTKKLYVLGLLFSLAIGVLCSIGTLSSHTVYAYSTPEEINATYTYSIINENDCEVRISNRAEATIAVIPSKAIINGKEYTVKEIALNGFASCPNLKRVAISRSIEIIDIAAFINCQVLSHVSLANVQEIGSNAFARCPQLSKIVIPYSVKKMGNSVFMFNSTKVDVRATEEDVSSLEWNANWNADNSISEVNFNSSYKEELILDPIYKTVTTSTLGISTYSTEIDSYIVAAGQPFSDDYYIQSGENIIIPAEYNGKKITEIKHDAFGNNSFDQLIVEYSDSPININSQAFAFSFINNITINRSVSFNDSENNISFNVFLNSSVSNLILPDTIDIIPLAAFQLCFDLADINFITPQPMDRYELLNLHNEIEQDGIVILPESVSIIKESAFAYTSMLKELYIPNNVRTIESNIVNESGINKIWIDYLEGTTPDWDENSKSGFNSQFVNKENDFQKVYYKERVSFDADGGEISIDHIDVWKGEKINKFPEATMNNLIFDGWYTSKDGEGTHYTSSTPINSNITLYAKWLVTITFNSDGGSSCGSLKVTKGKTTTLPTSNLTGATFDGWYTSKDGEGTHYTSSTPINSNITLYAKWLVTITFNSDGGSSCNSITMIRRKTTTLPTSNLTGATFDGWYTSKDGEGTHYTSSTPINSNITLYAKWLVTITFNSDGGSSCNSITLTRGKTTPLPTSTKNTLTFRGWYTNKNGTGTQYTSSTKINSDITLYANWAVHISFDLQGGTGIQEIYATVNVDMPKVVVPQKSGYKFMGYYTSKNGVGTKYYNYDMSSAHICNFTSDKTLYAYWQEKTFEECEVSPNVYELATSNQLKSLNGKTVQNYTINIMSNIDVGTWSGIAKFSGLLNGNGHTITYSNTAVRYGETFGFISVNNGTIKDIHFKPTIKVTGKTSSSQSSVMAYVGGAVGQNNGSLENVVIDKTVNSPYMDTSGSCNVDIYAYVALWLHIGGVAGMNSGTMLKCTNNASIGGGESMGGIVGINDINSTINGCVNNGNIYYDFATVANPLVGGIADTIRKGGSIYNCTNNASIIWAAKTNSSEQYFVYMAQLAGQAETTAKFSNNNLFGKVEIVQQVMLKLTDKQLQNVVDSDVAYWFTA